MGPDVTSSLPFIFPKLLFPSEVTLWGGVKLWEAEPQGLDLEMCQRCSALGEVPMNNR